MDRWKLKELK
jgi:hypothetical protein